MKTYILNNHESKYDIGNYKLFVPSDNENMTYQKLWGQ